MSKRRKDWRVRVTPQMLQERARFNAKLRDAKDRAFERAMFACCLRAAASLDRQVSGENISGSRPDCAADWWGGASSSTTALVVQSAEAQQGIPQR